MPTAGVSALSTLSSDGRTDVCSGNVALEWATGGGYGFLLRKRDVADESCAAFGPCENYQEPNVVGLVDGTEYDIAGLNTADFKEL